MTPEGYMIAARVPRSVKPQEFGLWTIERLCADDINLARREIAWPADKVGFPDYTLLRRWTDDTIYSGAPEIVMEDSKQELRKHLPIWMQAYGHVLKTGLGLGCVVRGLLIKPEITQVTVVEIDEDIIRVIGAEFVGNPRVEIIHADALTWEPGDRQFNFAWHDIWTPNNEGLQRLHLKMISRYKAAVQGAWAFPRFAHRVMAETGHPLLGGPNYG